MKIKFKNGNKCEGDKLFFIETNGEEAFTHARLMTLINQLTINEFKIYKTGEWDKKGKDFLFEFAVKDAIEMIKEQNYRCTHCKIKLQCTFGTQQDRNCWGASLDRIDTNIIGYGNGNSQWLCMCCNNGKNTMADFEHKTRFSFRDAKIKHLESEVKRLTKIIKKSGFNEHGCS